MNLSKHFTRAEFERSQTALRRGLANVMPQAALENARRLCGEVLEPIRAHFGPVLVTSGYRSVALNEAIGGSPHSQHCEGCAADIVAPGVPAIEVCKWVRAEGLPYDQLIHEGDWTHVSWCAEDRRRGHCLTARFAGGRASYVPGLHA